MITPTSNIDSDALTEPIFRDIPEDISEDWNFGVLVGGMVSDDVINARAFKRAADLLVEEGLKSREPYEVAYPILALYRHAIELYLKAIVRPTVVNHKFGPLVEALDTLLKTKHGQRLPGWAKDRFNDFAAIDEDSFAFRYAHTKRGKLTIPDECWVELGHLRTVVNALADGFEKLVGTD